MSTIVAIQASGRPRFLDLDLVSLRALFKESGIEAFRVQQIGDWIFKKGVADPTGWTNISEKTRTKLREIFDWTFPSIRERLDAADGTTKLLLTTDGTFQFEAVIMRYENRVTLCISSQVGCKMACTFCQTGKLGFFRHLAAADLLSQVVVANQLLAPEGKSITHVVFMGMGEPFDNYAATVRAANTMMDPEFGFGISSRRVTVSTSGIPEAIERFGAECRASLAISLHAADDALRTSLMPINRKYPLVELKRALINYQRATDRKITFEYILIKNCNTDEASAKKLVRFLEGIQAKVNLIAFNPHPGLPFERPTEDEMLRFQKYLSSRSIPSPVRYSRGLDVSGGCGQLAAKTQDVIHATPLRNRVRAGDPQDLRVDR